MGTCKIDDYLTLGKLYENTAMGCAMDPEACKTEEAMECIAMCSGCAEDEDDDTKCPGRCAACSGYAYCLEEPGLAECVTEDMRWTKGSMGKFADQTAEECYQRCKDTDKCKAWTFAAKKKLPKKPCSLFKKAVKKNKLKAKKKFLSGSAKCHPTKGEM